MRKIKAYEMATGVGNSTDMIPIQIDDLKNATDFGYIIISVFIILTMQTGFGLLESGMVSRKNEANVMVKNTLDLVLGGLSFWLFGYGFGFGPSGNSFASASYFATDSDISEKPNIYLDFLMQLAFATTAATIISGSVADRVSLKAYMFLAFIFTGLIYPIPAHWMWHPEGWLKKLGAYDFAGCAAIHIGGGTAALVSCVMIGPRLQRYTDGVAAKYFMASPTNVMVGTLFLWFGWIGFNFGSLYGVSSGLWKLSGRVATVTITGAIGGGISGILISGLMIRKRDYLLDIPQFSAGILGGLVGITGVSSSCQAWEGFVIGFIGGLLCNGAITLFDKIKVDDPVGAIGVHFVGGYWGMIAVGIFGKKDSVVGLLPSNGLVYGGNGKLLGYNVMAAFVTTLWSGVLTAVMILILKKVIGFRLTEDKELRGSDDVEHNIKDPLVIMEAKQIFNARVSIPLPTNPDMLPERKRSLQLKIYEN